MTIEVTYRMTPLVAPPTTGQVQLPPRIPGWLIGQENRTVAQVVPGVGVYATYGGGA